VSSWKTTPCIQARRSLRRAGAAPAGHGVLPLRRPNISRNVRDEQPPTRPGRRFPARLRLVTVTCATPIRRASSLVLGARGASGDEPEPSRRIGRSEHPSRPLDAGLCAARGLCRWRGLEPALMPTPRAPESPGATPIHRQPAERDQDRRRSSAGTRLPRARPAAREPRLRKSGSCGPQDGDDRGGDADVARALPHSTHCRERDHRQAPGVGRNVGSKKRRVDAEVALGLVRRDHLLVPTARAPGTPERSPRR